MAEPQIDLKKIAELRAKAFAAMYRANAAPMPPAEASAIEWERFQQFHKSAIVACREYLDSVMSFPQ